MEDVEKLLKKLDEKKLYSKGDESKKYSELQELMKQIDLSLLQKKVTPPEKRISGSKKRKMPTAAKKKEIQSMKEKDLEEIATQIEIVKKTLQHIYDMENTSFKEVVSKKNKKRQVVYKKTLMDRILVNGRVIPLWVGTPDEQPPPLCGGVEADVNYEAQVGDLVCALIGKEDTKTWCLAEVLAYDSENEKYTVDDIYEDEKVEHIIDKEDIIILPKYRANPKCNPEALFPVQALVLALSPQTTCFYRGVISKQPEKANEPYMVMFEDNRYVCNYAPPAPVEQRYVLRYRPISGQDPDEEETEEEVEEN